MTRQRLTRAVLTMRSRTRLVAAGVVGVAVGLSTPRSLGWECRIVAGWDASALVMLALLWWLMAAADADATRDHARAGDLIDRAVSLFVLATSSAGLVATAGLLRDTKAHVPNAPVLFALLCLVAVATAWALAHAIFALRYATVYYDDEPTCHLDFPGSVAPNYVDFAYLAFTIGLTFAVADVRVMTTAMRRVVLGHAVMSFTYSAVILASAINLMFTLLR